MKWFLLLGAVLAVSAVDRAKFRRCIDTAFCRRHREDKSLTDYKIVSNSLKFNDTALHAILKNKENSLVLDIVALKDSTIRLVIDEFEGKEARVRTRWQPLDALAKAEPEQQKIKKSEVGKEESWFETEDGHKVVVQHKPFRVDLYAKGTLVTTINSRNWLRFEHFRKGKKTKDGDGFWEEKWGDHKDMKPHGSSSVSVDIALLGFKMAYGLPEHSETYALRSTNNYEPYRLYNLDVFEYEINNPMALYGSVPYLAATNPRRTLGVLWLNPSETWVDYDISRADLGVVGKLVETEDERADRIPQINTRFISETGLIDVFFFLGPKPHDLFRQYSKLTGVTPVPPQFSLGYHQCRWNYKDEKDVREVIAKFDENEIPMDVIWLDIEHTDEKRYFTWDKEKFPEPKQMVEDVAKKGRKMVLIVDPHIKKDKNYTIYKEARKKGFLVKELGGKKTFVGNCWPQDSVYIDFTNPEARKWWSEKFALDKYEGTTEDVHIWNDMNEPSVFNGPEITMPKDLVHYDDREHREVHNMYGFYQHEATHNGLIQRSERKLRPFVLTRAFFAGSQRTAAVWTGDNAATWEHLKASIPMLLTLSTAGIPFVGADVGGFFKDTDPELLVRWAQAGAFQPFFRAHAHTDTKRREPYLLDENFRAAYKKAIETRYKFLPYIYTIFYEHSKNGKPVMRPHWLELVEDEVGYDEDRQWLVGNAILVKPTLEAGETRTSVYLPGKREIWYEFDTGKARPSPGAMQIETPIDKIAVFQRGGTIIPIREMDGPRASLAETKADPVSLYIGLNNRGDSANGTIYLDDGETFAYEKGEFAFWGFTFKKEHDYLFTITSKNLDKKGKLESEILIDKIYLRGVKFYPQTAHIYLDDFVPEDLPFEHDRDSQQIVISNVGAYLTKEWKIDLHG
ncbi:unnamed protein product, partial [Mesorhabditis belari]|uniref:Glycoside hydrolase family 31 N-terminal domain-containing protein n=1 Tax=Mesorhabditis belari TaxID=2138241 RepID=A0AAF3FQG7_9BILA